MINNVHYDSAMARISGKIALPPVEIAYMNMEAVLSTAFEARTQTLIALYAVLEPGLERQQVFTEIMERIYG